MGELNGRAIVVTGGGRGIGAAVASGLAAEGACVMVNDLGVQIDGSSADAGPAQEVVDRIVAAGGVAIADATDVTDFVGAENLRRYKVRFANRVWPGDTITCKGRVTRVYDEGGERRVDGEVAALTQRGETAVTGTFLVLVHIVVAANARVWWELLSGRRPADLREEAYVPLAPAPATK